MHDKRGRLIEQGDFLKVEKFGGPKVTKRIAEAVELMPGSDTCNLNVAFATAWNGIQIQLVTASETEIVLKADGSDPVDLDPEKTE